MSMYVMRKGVAQLSDLVDGNKALSPFGVGVGNVYYVNGVTWANGFIAGSDGNEGTFEAPLHTITEALSRCVTEGNDAIVVLDYWQATGETWPIAVNKNLVSLYGVGAKPYESWCALSSDGAYPIFDITGNNVLLDGFNLNPGSSAAGITMDGGTSRVWVRNCLFADGTYGVHLTAADTGFAIAITDCGFIASLTTGGIYVADDPAGLHIARNWFDQHTGISIDIEQGAYHRILDNRFALKAATQGLAITLGSGVSRAFVDGNHAAYGNDSTTQVYEDEGTVTTNNWGTNWMGKAVVEAA